MDTRLKIRYSLAETRNDLYTYGGEWQTEDGVEYRGLYHQYVTTQETFTQPKWNPTASKRLVAFVKTPENVKRYVELNSVDVKFQSPNHAKVRITEENRQAGFVMRYFLKKINETTIIEISKEQYDEFNNKKIDNNLYVAGALKWTITGPLQTIESPIKIPSVSELNRQAVRVLQPTLPGISTKLSNLTEFYSDTDFIVPKNIN
jgi:hypothetical protein